MRRTGKKNVLSSSPEREMQFRDESAMPKAFSRAQQSDSSSLHTNAITQNAAEPGKSSAPLNSEQAEATRKSTLNNARVATKPIESVQKYAFSADIPQQYNQTYIRALPRDPEWLFVYWEFSPDTVNKIQKELGADFLDCHPTIRLKELDCLIDESIDLPLLDIEIDMRAGNKYIQVPGLGRCYKVEYGHVINKGDFVAMPEISCEQVSMPLAQISEQGGPDTWISVRTDKILEFTAANLPRNDIQNAGTNISNTGSSAFLPFQGR